MIHIQWFGPLRERMGRGDDQVDFREGSALDLFRSLRGDLRFGMEPSSLRVAVNDEMADWSQPLCDDDLVVFLAPMGGG